MSIFREYDIRGIADRDLTNKVTFSLGKVLGLRARAEGEKNAYIGQDARLSSPRLAEALSAGFEAAGIAVRKQSLGPTPLLYYCAHEATEDFPTKTGVMITGSHNPPEYNGFKIVLNGNTLFGDDIQSLKNAVEAELSAAPEHPVASSKFIDRTDDYVSFIKNNIRVERKIRVVVDAGNGAAGPLAIKSYEAIGCEVIPLFCDPDGSFPNHHPDPTVPKNLTHLIQKVLETKADLGIGYDGDGDRIGAVSATGNILFGDHLVLYFARDILKEIPGATIISEVKSSQILYDLLDKWGAKSILWKTGHSLIKAKLKETRAALAGEMSGHMFFAHRFFGFDDAIYSGARLIEGLSRREETLDQFLASLPPMTNTPELRVDCDDNVKFDLVKKFTAAAQKKYGAQVNSIDGARIKLHSGWGLLRASNTQPVLVMRFEAPDRERLAQIREDFVALFKEIGAQVEVPAV